MNGKKAKLLRKFLGKTLPQTRCVQDGTTREVVMLGKVVTIENWVPQELTDEEKQTRTEYRRLKKMYKNGELPL